MRATVCQRSASQVRHGRTKFNIPWIGLRCDASSLHLSMPPLSLATGGRPLVIDDPSSETAGAFMELGAAVVREVAKLEAMPRNAVR